MEKKNIFIGVGAILVIFGLVWWGTQMDVRNTSQSGSNNNEDEEVINNLPLTPAAEEVSLPQSDIRGAALKVFNITMTRGGIVPSSITVGEGDRVQFNVKAEDAPYDFELEVPHYNFRLDVIEEGETRPVGFNAESIGEFSFGCSQLCPNNIRLTAQLIVLDR